MDNIDVLGVLCRERVASKFRGWDDGLVLKDQGEGFGLLLPLEFPAPLLRRHTAELLA
jgi:hypothetical protein